MINTYHTSLPPPPPVPPRIVQSRPEARQYTGLLWFLAVVLVLHMLLTFGGFIYLFDKGNQASHWQGEFHEKYLDDFLILKRVQKCDDDKLDDQSLLDCKQLVDKFRGVVAKASQAEGRVAMLTGEHFQGALAHMYVQRSSKTCTAQNSQHCSLEWNLDHSVRVSVDTVGISRLRISQAGYYYVYSQVTFSASDSVAPSENIIRRVKLKEPNCKQPDESGEVLVSAYCPPKQSSLCTSSQGGVFKLEKGEQLYVEVTDLGWVHYDWNATFFGLYKL